MISAVKSGGVIRLIEHLEGMKISYIDDVDVQAVEINIGIIQS